MSIFTSIGNWLVGVFNKTRPGLLQFLHDYEGPAVEEIGKLAKQFAGMPLDQWRGEAFKAMGELAKDGAANPGAWLTILYNLAYDIYKESEAKKAPPTS